MALKAFKKIDFKDKDSSRLQENIQSYLSQFNDVTLDGVVLTNVTVGTAITNIPHTLGREFQGWHLLDIQGDARVWRDTGSNSDSNKFLPLKASASVVVSLWVY